MNMIKVELKDTIDLMMSTDYKERFIAEYLQTKIRYEKLKHFCDTIEVAQEMGSKIEEPKHDCSIYMLRDQQRMMGNYLGILEKRAIVEGIEL